MILLRRHWRWLRFLRRPTYLLTDLLTSLLTYSRTYLLTDVLPKEKLDSRKSLRQGRGDVVCCVFLCDFALRIVRKRGPGEARRQPREPSRGVLGSRRTFLKDCFFFARPGGPLGGPREIWKLFVVDLGGAKSPEATPMSSEGEPRRGPRRFRNHL